jgi:CubicO group peptidase (beta-lactamase class C family)
MLEACRATFGTCVARRIRTRTRTRTRWSLTAWALAAAVLTPAAPAAEAPEAAVTRLDATQITAGQIDAIATQAMQRAGVPGLGIALFNDGKVVYTQAYGERDQAAHKPLTPDSIMTAASLTKPAFAVLVMQLVEQGVLDLDRPVIQYLPKPLPDYAPYSDLASDRRHEKITLRMLLAHTPGFPNWRRFTADKKLAIYFEPGSRFAYSGEGIALAQFVVETVTGRSAEALMRERIFQPLGMTRTSLVWQPHFEADHANAYKGNGKSLGPQRRERPDTAGSMQTTLRDYARFVEAMLNGELLREKSTTEMFSPQIRITSAREFPTLAPETTTANDAIRLSYGLAWGLYWTPYGKAVFKEGHDDGFQHYVVMFTDVRSGLLIMTNSDHGESLYGELIEPFLRNPFTPYEWEGFARPPRPMQ